MNGLIIDGKVYETKPEISPVSCAGCDLDKDDIGCPYTGVCYEWHCVFRYSQTLTDRLTSVEVFHKVSDKLTEAEKESIIKFYKTVWGKSVHKIQSELTAIFGSELFTEK